MRILILLFISLSAFAQIPWPHIGPDVTGGKGPGGHTYNSPAKSCYRALGVDTSFYGAPIAITAISWSGKVVTITIASTTGFTETAVITVSGVTPTGYNGMYALGSQSNSVSPLTSTTLKFNKPVNPGTATVLGTVQYTPQVLAFDASLCYASF